MGVLEDTYRLSREQALEALKLLEEKSRRQQQRKIEYYYPEEGPLARGKYPKHQEFFKLGATIKYRLAMCANRVGKTEGMGGYEMVCHLTGNYPPWWEGKRFDRAIAAWAAGTSAKDVRDSVQQKLCGRISELGTGLIPGNLLGRKTMKSGVPDAIDTIQVKHRTGRWSSLTFKSYEGGRESFQASDIDVIWLDEEPPLEVYTEAATRTMTTHGTVMLTFTPLLGMSEVVLQFLPGGEIKELQDPMKAVIMATWDDAPHLTEQMKAEMLAAYPPYQRDARSKGIPQLGAGAIYPVPESEIRVSPFPIPAHWPRGYGMDVGWNSTAAIWGAWDRDSDVLYLTDGYKVGEKEPSIHAAAIRGRGDWIPGFIDPASRGRGQRDGSQLLVDYRNLGLQLQLADNGVESGLLAVWNRMSTGRLKVFSSIPGWFEEYRLYRRDERGHVVKAFDHLMDCTRYLESRTAKMIVKPVIKPSNVPKRSSQWG